jgi:hypothetical protein
MELKIKVILPSMMMAATAFSENAERLMGISALGRKTKKQTPKKTK